MKRAKRISHRFFTAVGYGVIALQVLTVFSSCVSEETLTDEALPIRLVVNCQPQTRGTSGAASQSTAFDEGANINVYIVESDYTVISNNQTFTAGAASGGKNTLTPPDATRPPYYPNGDKTVNIKAFYPSTVTTAATSFAVQTDQTTQSTNETEDTYKLSDLMTASVTSQVKTNEDVNLEFHHRMAKININATATDGLTIESIKLANVKTTASYVSATDTWSGSGDAGTIILAKDGTEATLSGVALFPAQTIEGKTFIQVVTDKGTANFAVTSKAFQEGYDYTASLEVGLQNLTMTSAITDWNAATGTATITKVNRFGMYIESINESFTYDGSEKVPSTVVVKYENNGSEQTLEENTDYTLKYYNHINVGEALVVAEGLKSDKGDFRGSAAVQSYTIGQATPYMAFQTTGTIDREFAWNDSYTNTLTSESLYDGVLTWSSSDTNIATVIDGVVSISKPGTVNIRVANDGSGNYEATSTQYTLHISKRIFKNHVSITELGSYNTLYDGSEKRPVPVVYDGTKRLGDNDGYYTIAYSNNINAGDDLASVTLTGTGAYYDNTTVSKTFDIDKVTPIITMTTTAKTIGVGATYECDATTTYGNVVYSSSDETVASVNSSTGVVSAIKAGGVTITASVAAGDNWNAATDVEISITVQKQEESWTTPGSYTYSCPATAIYSFEVVGAAGGNYSRGTGGYGGIVKAKKKLTAGTVVYIYVGSQGQTGNGVAGGTNGSGTGYGGASGSSGGGSGGACTEIRIGGTDVSNRHIVAGGGGGSSGNRRSGRDGGTSTSGGYSYSYGESVTYYDVSGGGGGGYYGGRQGTFMGGGYGGSNYLDSSWTMISAGTTTKGPKSASDTNSYNGYVKVTYEFE